MADALDSKSSMPQGMCGFNSHLRYFKWEKDLRRYVSPFFVEIIPSGVFFVLGRSVVLGRWWRYV